MTRIVVHMDVNGTKNEFSVPLDHGRLLVDRNTGMFLDLKFKSSSDEKKVECVQDVAFIRLLKTVKTSDLDEVKGKSEKHWGNILNSRKQEIVYLESERTAFLKQMEVCTGDEFEDAKTDIRMSELATELTSTSLMIGKHKQELSKLSSECCTVEYIEKTTTHYVDIPSGKYVKIQFDLITPFHFLWILDQTSNPYPMLIFTTTKKETITLSKNPASKSVAETKSVVVKTKPKASAFNCFCLED